MTTENRFGNLKTRLHRPPSQTELITDGSERWTRTDIPTPPSTSISSIDTQKPGDLKQTRVINCFRKCLKVVIS